MNWFWESWMDRFESNQVEYITPDDEYVVAFSEDIDIPDCDCDKKKAKSIWLKITDGIDYRLSKEWKTPRQTLTDMMGDCEDYVFLFLSVAPNVGLTDVEMAIGYLRKGGKTGAGGPHVWVEVDGMVVDPTGYPTDVEDMEYKPVQKYEIDYNG